MYHSQWACVVVTAALFLETYSLSVPLSEELTVDAVYPEEAALVSVVWSLAFLQRQQQALWLLFARPTASKVSLAVF